MYVKEINWDSNTHATPPASPSPGAKKEVSVDRVMIHTFITIMKTIFVLIDHSLNTRTLQMTMKFYQN